MMDQRLSLFDPEALAIVLIGTALATLLGQGCGNLRMAWLMAAGLIGRQFDESANRAALARVVYAINRKGRYGAEAVLPADKALGRVVAAYLRWGQIAQMHAVWQAERSAARMRRATSVAVWRYAGELSPVFGLVGTLFAITRLVPEAGSSFAENTAAAIATAVVSSLYGLLLAQLVCLPLASAIARRSLAEERARKELLDWFESQLPAVRPGGTHQTKSVLLEVA
ncbi:MAG: MotA/TolQ/ExbB proton channel family protein [Erythrobacter sp.]